MPATLALDSACYLQGKFEQQYCIAYCPFALTRL